MPVYNGGRYFELALESALAQTYDDLEIVVVNDGSDDGGVTEAIAQRFAATRPDRVRYVAQFNTGVSGALNTGVRQMTGDIFCWLSHDDLFTPDKTAVQADLWRRLGRREAIVFSDYGVIGPEGEMIAAGAFEHALFMAAPRLPLYRGGVNGCTVFIPAQLLRGRAEPFDAALKFAGDYRLWADLLRDHEFLHVPRSLVYSRRHPGQDSWRPDVAGEGEALWRGMVDGLSDVEKTQLYGSTRRFFDRTHAILRKSPYRKVAAYLAEAADRSATDAMVSVVLPIGNAAATARAAESVLNQTHARLELLFVGRQGPPDLLAVLSDPRARLAEPAVGGGFSDLDFALLQAGGSYIAVLEAGWTWAPDKLQMQLEAMTGDGALLSDTAVHHEPAGPQTLDRPIALSTMMAHRSLIAGGFMVSDWPRLLQDPRMRPSRLAAPLSFEPGA